MTYSSRPLLTLGLLLTVGFSLSHVAWGGPTKASLGGQWLRDVSTKKIWFAEQTSGFRYDVTQTKALQALIRRAALLVTNEQLAAIPLSGSSESGNTVVRNRYAGRFITAGNASYWYVAPATQQRLDVTDLTSGLSLSRNVQSTELALWPTDPGVRSTTKRITTPRGTFSIKYVVVNLINPQIRVMTDNVAPGLGTCACQCNPESMCGADYRALCPKTCGVRSFPEFIRLRQPLAAINGAYFHDAPFATFSGIGSDLSVQNSFSPKQELTRDPWASTLEHPIIIDSTNRFIVDMPNPGCSRNGYTDKPLSRDLTFRTYTDCIRSAVNRRSTQLGGSGQLQALISTDSFLVFNRKNTVTKYPLDTKQRTVRTSRDFFGVRGQLLYFVVVSGATVPDAAAVATAMQLDMAANLDGGASSALYANGTYLVRPSRSIPNALFVTR
ncbi:MAG: phosphodiester glycosidase family protein [Candidatus Kerfeldbacteria bacterium]|nr:phosphodiester glycosidase family protein [Candidatus Kerfeldbacteria bacterium]